MAKAIELARILLCELAVLLATFATAVIVIYIIPLEPRWQFLPIFVTCVLTQVWAILYLSAPPKPMPVYEYEWFVSYTHEHGAGNITLWIPSLNRMTNAALREIETGLYGRDKVKVAIMCFQLLSKREKQDDKTQNP